MGRHAQINLVIAGGAIRGNLRQKITRKRSVSGLELFVQKTVRKFDTLAEAEKADREFYKKLSGNERLQILVELLNHAPEQRLETVSRITKLPRY